MALPKTCSFRDKDVDCPLPPSYIVSVGDNSEEYMIAVVCQDHKDQMEKRLKAMQSARKIPQGNAKFQDIKLVVTDCIRDTDDNSLLDSKQMEAAHYLVIDQGDSENPAADSANEDNNKLRYCLYDSWFIVASGKSLLQLKIYSNDRG